MFEIDGDTIHITRRDRGVIELEIDDYTFSVGDKVEFRVYETKSLDKLPVLNKKIEIKEECTLIEIELTPEDTAISDVRNNSKTYWYEIELNDNNTVIGYDEDGPKLLIVYPDGREVDDTSEE